MIETLSDTLDIQAKIKKEMKKKEAIKYNKYYKKLEKFIVKELEKTKKILGNRFSYKKQHNTMYYFYFDISIDELTNNLVFYFCPDSEKYTIPIKQVLLDITSYMNSYRYKYDYLNDIKLKDLSGKIVDSINLVVNDFYKEKSK